LEGCGPAFFGSWIRIRIRVKSWIRIRIRIEIKIQQRLKIEPWTLIMGLDAQNGALEGNYTPVVANSLLLYEDPDPPFFK
jgi:hypothetical protein